MTSLSATTTPKRRLHSSFSVERMMSITFFGVDDNNNFTIFLFLLLVPTKTSRESHCVYVGEGTGGGGACGVWYYEQQRCCEVRKEEEISINAVTEELYLRVP